MGMQQKVRALYPEDDTIIALYFARDEQAITETDRKYGNYLQRIAYTILQNESDCEECRNDTYVNAWNSIPPTTPTVLSAFLAKIIRSLAIDKWRQDRRQKRVPPELLTDFSDVENFLSDTDDTFSAVQARQIIDIINKYLRRLSQRRRYIFLCRYYYLRPIADIAKTLSISKSTVNRTLSSVKKELRELLEREGIYS